jgi:hypothetical protein
MLILIGFVSPIFFHFPVPYPSKEGPKFPSKAENVTIVQNLSPHVPSLSPSGKVETGMFYMGQSNPLSNSVEQIL